MKNWRLSLYGRALLKLTLGILVIFIVLALVYTSIFTVATRRQRAEDLARNSTEIANLTSRYLSFGEVISVSREATNYWSFAARSTGALVWIVNSAGEIIYTTGVPEYALTKLERSSDNYLLLPEELLNYDKIAHERFLRFFSLTFCHTRNFIFLEGDDATNDIFLFTLKINCKHTVPPFRFRLTGRNVRGNLWQNYSEQMEFEESQTVFR